MEPEMTQTALVELLRLFENAKIAVWLDGGWGVDALLQTQTRTHKDVDRAMRSFEETSPAARSGDLRRARVLDADLDLRYANNAIIIGCGLRAASAISFRRQAAKVIAHVQLHAIDFRQETRGSGSVVDRVLFRLAEMRELLLEPGNALQSGFQFLLVRDHDFFSTISTMPRRPPSHLRGHEIST
jgi:hypothetical protein